jgi:hypothetical protein
MSSQFPCAGIDIEIIKFVPSARITLDQAKYTTAHVRLIGNATGKVSQSAVDKDIRVDRLAQVDLCFRVRSPEDQDDKPAYNPVGVSFFDHDGDLGLDDFPTRVVETDPFNRLALTVHDANVNGSEYKFNLLIQKVSTGEIGVIDPQINNGHLAPAKA